MEWETVIGLEVHAQLLTQSKMFCACPADYQDAPPNTRVCPVCLGMPGTLPVINRRAVEYVIMTGLAVNCEINEHTFFDRKNYPYPDLMKGYQISQFPMPIAKNGWMDLEVEGHTKRVGITRIHLEEDVAKMMHIHEPTGESYSLIDVNRSSVPLMETVSEPDMRSPEEARQYLTKLQSILRFIGVSTADMEKGSFRCDANVSIRPKGSTTLGAKVEVKNMNSTRSVARAIQFEVERQIKVLEQGGRIIQETRGWVEERGLTVSQRSKEVASDYRYFPEPDLPPLVISREQVNTLRKALPELPDALRERFMAQYALPAYDARQLTATRAMAQFFERTVGGNKGRAKAVSNWIISELSRLLAAAQKEVDDYPEATLKTWSTGINQMIELVDAGTISSTQAKAVFDEVFTTGKEPTAIVQEKGLAQVSDTSTLKTIIDDAIAGNPQAVADYKAGKDTAMKFLVGQVMKLSKGKANPGLVNGLLKGKLESLKG
ncbi:MAG: Asp-tRNA(Asn)/Glu-tRNA(Gln) amidotransferase subunit GatB [Dehalococcoidia bacterium]|nr:Asp-tRNA(Asn)/Glu-tRNA(Gln) amidotransferase subunit GatB [Dehalococcoidia bacterium]